MYLKSKILQNFEKKNEIYFIHPYSVNKHIKFEVNVSSISYPKTKCFLSKSIPNYDVRFSNAFFVTSAFCNLHFTSTCTQEDVSFVHISDVFFYGACPSLPVPGSSPPPPNRRDDWTRQCYSIRTRIDVTVCPRNQ